ncbi:hypothetical protein [Streptomyces sp. NPDC050264]|uniref:hypothetical protein n=1 Tax=Streptomyces sp. NPDC050264 TaxID=3155038 RepID=UPI0034419830
MSPTCRLCETNTAHRYLCPRCAYALAERLERLPELDNELIHCLIPRRSGWGDIIATRSAAGPQSPLDETVLDELNSGQMTAVVRSWRVDVQRVRWPQHAAPPPGGLAADCRWLVMEMDWILKNYSPAGDLAREVRELEAHARSLVGDPVPRLQHLGTCVTAHADGRVCGAVIKRLPGETRVRCRECGYTYATALDWMRLQHFQPDESTELTVP